VEQLREAANGQARALGELAAHLSGAQRDEVIGEALVAAKAIGSEDVRAEVLSELAAQLNQEQQGDALRTFLLAEQRLTRPSFLRLMDPFTPAIAHFGGEGTLWEFAKAVAETGRWFP
jgi:hypothetical protein